ncbi:MAG: serine protein kinase PrkA [Candidatus Niyogibacteria bacterium]|nr:MAG: serine protein kinase PrkA [Candidatus Niyogibacteria bacterium]
MADIQEALQFLGTEVDRKDQKTLLSFPEYLEYVCENPQMALRNIFRLFYDMVKGRVVEEDDGHPDDPESVGFKKYDCSKLLVEGADNPFFADRLFANRFVRQVESLRQGFQQNRIYVYEGPSGCGKSTFLNNLLRSFEDYMRTDEGRTFEIIWEIDEAAFQVGATPSADQNRRKLIVPCPNHDHPILIIPKEHRVKFVEKLLENSKAKKIILTEKDYEWLFREEVCTICKSIFVSSLEKLGSVEEVLKMLKARPYKFDRRVGEGISIFNPGDKPVWSAAEGVPVEGFSANRQIQDKLDEIFGPNAVRYVFSPLAKTNGGIYVLMDIKAHNKERFLELHNVISEGVRKVGDVEECINSFFFALMNPEDKAVIEEAKMESFQGRIHYNKIPYVLEPATEVNIYRSVFGRSIDKHFLPRVLDNFARVIISGRMNTECETLKGWIPNLKKYDIYCDKDGLLLRMEIYGGVIPTWLSEEEKKKFTASVRRSLIAEGEKEGNKGFSGRDSIGLFNSFLVIYGGRLGLINMENVVDFFKDKIGKERRDKNIPKEFLASLLGSYDYAVLGEVKEALYFYNTDQIQKDILNYLWAVNYEIGSKTRCGYTGEELEVTIDFFKLMAGRISGEEMTNTAALKFAQDIQKKYVTSIARERVNIVETELYREIFGDYVGNLKEKVLEPFVGNDSFREAIKSYGTKEFDTFDRRLREHVAYMIKSLMGNFGYTQQGAKEICLYVLDKKLNDKFSS